MNSRIIDALTIGTIVVVFIVIISALSQYGAASLDDYQSSFNAIGYINE